MHERGQIHEQETPGFGSIGRSISVNVRKFPSEGSWNVSDHICSLPPNLFPHFWCNLVVTISNIKTFVDFHPPFDQRWNNILKKEMHPIPWIALLLGIYINIPYFSFPFCHSHTYNYSFSLTQSMSRMVLQRRYHFIT
jgi:hypothetical protein